MLTISKNIKFDCAHMLSGYEGKCSNLHGHTYHGTVTLTGVPDEKTSMLVDYNDIKNLVDKFDHAVLFSQLEYRNTAETELFEWAYRNDMKYVKMPYGKTTAETIARTMIQMFKSEFPQVAEVSVRLSETDGSWVEAH